MVEDGADVEGMLVQEMWFKFDSVRTVRLLLDLPRVKQVNSDLDTSST